METRFDHFVDLFKRCGIHLSPRQYELFWAFHRLIRERSRDIDLTRIKRFEEMVIKHYVDCALAATMTPLASPLLDIGSGAGFPGIPIKIIRPELQVILAESRSRRVTFLREVCRELGLEGIEIYPHKVTNAFSRQVETVITRALEPVSETLRRTGDLLPEGGRVVFMKGPECAAELDDAKRNYGREYRLTDNLSYTIPSTGHRRRLVIFERTGELMSSGGQESPGMAARGGKDMDRLSNAKEITSRANPVYKRFVQILSGRGIRKHHAALLSGPKQVREVLRDHPGRCLGLIISRKQRPDYPEPPSHIPIYRLHPELFREIDLFGTGREILLIRAELQGRWEDLDRPEGCTLFIPCQDPENVGALIRSAAAFGAARAVILKEAANPYHPKCLRAAGSTIFRIPILEGPSIEDLHSTEIPLIGLSPDGADVAGFRFPESFGLLPGLEGGGLPRNQRGATTLAVPMEPGVESLNTSVAAAVVLYLWRSQTLFRSRPPLKK